MKSLIDTLIRAAGIVALFGAIGLGANLFSSDGIPWVYVQAKTVDLSGAKVELVDEKEAREHYGNGETVFVDARTRDDYDKSHVEGAVFLSPEDVEERFVSVRDLLPEDGRIILYCYGPECDMAERVADFLGQLGYRNMMIMTAGYAAWKDAGYPVARSSREE
ncbi:MAG: rhodanese-like domain-containing protein [Desulfomonilaceae bacterium]|nr:rhodanese-like domain-containing protein [Desulfomonilaceae bacterium]